MKKVTALVLGMATSLSLIVHADQATTEDARWQNLTDLIQTAKGSFDFPSGTAVVAVKDGQIVYQQNFGYADIANKTLVQDDTSFYIASSTKPLFALAALLQEQQGKISESTNMTQLFPDMRFDHIKPEDVSVKHLLTHTMGFDNGPMVWATAYSGEHDYQSRRQLVAASYPNPEAPLGTYDYSNVGYNVLSVWFDQTYPQGWQQVLKETVFTPLNMAHTSAQMSDAEQPGWSVAQPYSFMHQPKLEKLYLSKQDNTMHSAGGVIASAGDLGRFVIAQLNQGKVKGEQVFPAEVIAKSQQLQVNFEREYGDYKRFGYAWGWTLSEYKDRVLHGHFGGFSGTSAHMSFMLNEGVGVVILNNEGTLYGNRTLTGIIANAVYGTLLLADETEIQELTQLNQDINQQIAALVKRVSSYEERMATTLEERAKRSWQLSLPKQAYGGTYRHPQIGDIDIQVDPANNINVSWGNLHATATAYEKAESVRLELAPGQGEVVQFQLEGEQVVSLSLDDMTFTRQ